MADMLKDIECGLKHAQVILVRSHLAMHKLHRRPSGELSFKRLIRLMQDVAEKDVGASRLQTSNRS